MTKRELDLTAALLSIVDAAAEIVTEEACGRLCYVDLREAVARMGAEAAEALDSTGDFREAS
jgi:hypothetical protein